MADLQPISDLAQFSYEVLEEYGVAHVSLPVLKVIAVAMNTEDARLSLACLTLVRVAVNDGIDGMSPQQAGSILDSISETLIDKRPFVRWHLQGDAASDLP